MPNLNRNDPNSLEWIGLLGQLKQLRKESPEADSVQFIIKRMMEKTEVEYKGNDEFLEKMWTIRRSPHKSEQMGLYPLEEEFLHFIEQAFHIYESKNRRQESHNHEHRNVATDRYLSFIRHV